MEQRRSGDPDGEPPTAYEAKAVGAVLCILFNNAEGVS